MAVPVSDPNNWECLTEDAGVLSTADGRPLLRKEQALGSGGFGAVCTYKHEGTGERVAVKVQAKNGKQSATSISREFSFGYELRHPNIAVTHAAFQTVTDVVFVMELVEGDNLLRRLLSSGAVAPPLACKYLLQLVRALQYMHDRGILHRDLKPANVVLVPGPQVGYCKLIDFGLSGRMENGYFDGILGLNKYLAPELSCENRAGPPADVFGLGYILFTSLLFKEPFQLPANRAAARAMYDNGPSRWSPAWFALPVNGKELLLALLKCAPSDRPTLAEIPQFSWVREHQAAADALCPPVPGSAVVYLAGEGYRNNLATDAARLVPTPMRDVVSQIMTHKNTEATMLYSMFRSRDAKNLHGSP